MVWYNKNYSKMNAEEVGQLSREFPDQSNHAILRLIFEDFQHKILHNPLNFLNFEYFFQIWCLIYEDSNRRIIGLLIYGIFSEVNVKFSFNFIMKVCGVISI